MRTRDRLFLGFLIGLCFCAVFLSAKGSSSQVSLSPSAWSIRYSSQMPSHPSALTAMAGWWFSFPPAPTGSVNYVTTAWTRPLLETQAIAFTAQVHLQSGTPLIQQTPEDGNTCQTAPTVRPYLEMRRFDKPGGTFPYQSMRWWSLYAMDLQVRDYSFTVVVPLDPAWWSNVNGIQGSSIPGEFSTAINSLQAIGLTFGGGCFFGHGVQVADGQATFILTGYSVQ